MSQAKQILNNNSRGSTHNNVKFPTIQLPKFSGSYDNWMETHETFLSFIHKYADIDNINKFHPKIFGGSCCDSYLVY